MSGKWARSLMLNAAPAPIYGFLIALQRTIRWTEINFGHAKDFWARRQPMIVAFWHGRMLMEPFFYRGRGIRILISHHTDGELICRVMGRFGFGSVRGSTRKRGLEAFRELVRVCRQGWDVAITPDGPRGPRYEVQKGVIELARQTELPIVPTTYSTRRRILCPSWDRFLIPWPFCRGVFLWGRPMWVDPRSDPGERERSRKELERRLRRMTEVADGFFEPAE